MADSPLTKCCVRCKAVRDRSAFSPSKQTKDGLKPYCKRCCAQHESARRQGSAGDEIRAKERSRREANPEHRLAVERRAAERRRQKPGYHERHRAETTARLEAAYKASGPVVVCVVCAVRFCNLFGRQSHRETCSTQCSRELARRCRWRKNAKRRALIKGAKAERVDVFAVFERDGWRCHLCGGLTIKAKRGSHHPKAPELDHVVPLSKGGEHSYRNTACAHRACNIAKSDRIVGQPSLLAA